MGLLSGGFETSENFHVQCDTELGQVDIAMRQDTKLDTSCLEVVTCSCEAGDKVLNYVHSMQLTPSGTSTQAYVELQIKIRVFTPWLFRTQAFSRLDSSLNRQLDSFVASLNGLVGKKLKKM